MQWCLEKGDQETSVSLFLKFSGEVPVSSCIFIDWPKSYSRFASIVISGWQVGFSYSSSFSHLKKSVHIKVWIWQTLLIQCFCSVYHLSLCLKSTILNWSPYQKLVNHLFTQITFIECLLCSETASTTCLALSELTVIYQFKELGNILERCFKIFTLIMSYKEVS